MSHKALTPDNDQSPDRQRGFTLIEVVIALTVFSIGLLAASMMQSSSIKGNKSAASISQASNWATSKMEEILTWPVTDPRVQDDGVNPNPPSTAPNVDTTPDGVETSPDGIYSMSWYVTANSPIPLTRTIFFTITWNVRGRQLSSQFTEILSP